MIHTDGIGQSLCISGCPVFLHVGDVFVRCQDTARTRDSVVKPLVGDVRTQTLNPCHVLQRSFPQQGAFQAPQLGAWSCGALSRLFRSRANVGSESSSSCWEARLDFWNCWVRDGWAVVSLHCLLPRLVCLGSAVGFSESSRASRKVAEATSKKCPIALQDVALAGVRLLLRLECRESAVWSQ